MVPELRLKGEKRKGRRPSTSKIPPSNKGKLEEKEHE